MELRSVVLGAVAAFAAVPALACYTVYDARGSIVYQAQQAPVDMSRPLHETMPRAFPGGHLVFGDSLDCQQQSPSQTFLRAVSDGSPPLLTDERSARALGQPYTVVGQDIALVHDRPADMRPGVVLAGSEPDTRAMGAGPAAPSGATLGTLMRPAPRGDRPRMYQAPLQSPASPRPDGSRR
ncbi:hypothetical protein [Ramlibacter sp.]|uniref:hypothetical protein n=1 Tax=Ramlibacter sp. TaxID=1917967 RepID=UPI002D563C3F|nr:hypothetical protein [Ramlibacter sp.]HYD76928.1 hypothetical protein [Ramlibacter sp.]